MRIAICEDDQPALEQLTEAIKDWAATKKIHMDILSYCSAEEFVMVWPDISFDLAFLDIQMKQMDGVELAEHIRKSDQNMLLVFVTSFDQYILRGYDVEALHYLIKPLSLPKLFPILDKSYMIWRSRQNEVLSISGKTGQYNLPFNDILYISMLAHNAEVHTMDKSYTIRKTAKELVGLLPSYFIRCHRSYIVNLLKIECTLNESLVLCNSNELPISRNKLKEVKDAFMRFRMG